MTQPALALEGIRVVDCSRVLAGPFCAMLLSDLGADVIKVEDTGSGDESRTWPPHKDGESAAFLVINRNKRDIALDLKQPEGVEALKRLVAGADVLIENFRTGTMESFGLGYDTLAALNPGLVYCSISAFGRTGPRKDGAGYEALMQAFSGIMSITGEPDGPPVRAGVSFLDLTTGIFSAFGIVNALLYRAKTGLGQRVDGSLLETAVKLLEDAGVPATPVNTVDQVMNDPQTAARQMIERVLHPRLGEIPVIGTPVKFSRMRPGARTPAPLQGEHTDQVLAEFGYSTDEISALRAKKVVR